MSPLIALFAAIGFFATDLDRAQNTILVLNLKPLGIGDKETLAVTAQVAERLAARSKSRIVTFGEINTLAEQQTDLMKLGCEDEGCIAELSKNANAQLVLSGSLGKIGDEIILSLSLIDVEAASSIASGSGTATSIEHISPAIDRALAQSFGWAGADSTTTRYRLPRGRAVSIAVMDIKPLGISDSAAANLTQLLAVELKRVKGTEVVSRADIASMLELQNEKIRLGCEDDTACLAEIGGALGVEKLVVGHAGKMGEQFVISLRLIDNKSVSVEGRVSEVFQGVQEQLLPAVRRAGRRLLGIADVDPGTLALSANEMNATVFFDNANVGELPMPPMPDLSPGRHGVRITKEGFFDWRSDVYVEPGGTTPLWAELQEEPDAWYKTWWFWTGVGVVVAASTVGTAFALGGGDTPENSDVRVDIAGGTP